MKTLLKITILILGLLYFNSSYGVEKELPKKVFEITLNNQLKEQDNSLSLGYAGMIGGRINNMILAGGGANFPNDKPWKGGQKVWSDNLYLYKDGSWKDAGIKLSQPIGYASSISIDNGFYYIGGNNKNGPSSDVYFITLSDVGEVIYKSTKKLPVERAFASVVKHKEYLYLLGGKDAKRSTNTVFRKKIGIEDDWEQLADFPGPSRALHTASVVGDQLYIFGGRSEEEGTLPQPLSTYITLDLKSFEWSVPEKILVNNQERVLMGGVATPMGSMNICFYGGSDEVIFNELVRLERDIKREENQKKKEALINKKVNILENHPGFSNEILSFNTVTKKWLVQEKVEATFPVTTLAVENGEELMIISGEISPGIRTPNTISVKAFPSENNFGTINYIILVAYLALSLLIGLYFSKKQKSTKDYFSGGGRIPWWASGLSAFGTMLSAITFMAIPAKSFSTDWSFFMLNITVIIITPLIASVFIPTFKRMKITTAYEYLENRFNYVTRIFSSLLFIFFQLGRIGIVLLLPSLAISIVTGISVEMSILIMGVICIIYTSFGGIEAVIWTDVLQVVVLLGGSVLVIFWLGSGIDLSFTEGIELAKNNGKFNILDMSLDFTKPTFWVVCIGGLASGMVTQGTDQTIVQRYLTSESEEDAKKTLYVNATIIFPATLIFFGIGTLLYLFYSQMPEKLPVNLENNDSIFPWFIVHELPVGISGVLIAGIFSAAMSSISSSLNSISTAFCNDFISKFKPDLEDRYLLTIARYSTITTGVISVTLALWMATSDIASLWDQFYKFLGLFTGGLGGLFLLGMLTKRANGKGAIIGLISSAVIVWTVGAKTDVNLLLYSLIGVISCFGIGYVFSILFPNKKINTIKDERAYSIN